MCLRINQDYPSLKEAKYYASIPLIAKKEIKVYKILEKRNREGTLGRSPFFYFEYQKGFQYSNDKFSYTYNDYGDKYYTYISEGLHAILDKNTAIDYKSGISDFFKLIIVEMYIPKGSKYFLGNRGDIVTNNLIWY